jgi:hypothetical protein
VAKDAELARLDAAIARWTHRRVLAVFRAVLRWGKVRPPRDLDAFARLMDRHLWMLLGRAATLQNEEFEREVRVTSDIIYYYLIRR